MTKSIEMPSAARAPSQTRLPDFFIVGHAKSGTTALYEMLRRHPQIFMPDLKETQFFARELHPRVEPSRRHPKTMEEYLSLFEAAKPDQRAGEASPSYIRSLTAAKRIRELRADARIIVILREPASFLRSLHLELLRDHIETETDLGRAIALSEVRREEYERSRPPVQQALIYSEHVRYVEQLRRYHAEFPPEQVLVLIYEEFLRDNEGTIRRVLRFLDVDDTVPIEITQANPTVRVRSPGAHGLVRSLYLGEGTAARVAKTTIKALTPAGLRRGTHAAVRRRLLYGKPREPDEGLMLALRGRFKQEVVALGEYLKRDDLVSMWGYDASG
jgi:hypothetical protein